MTGVLVLEDGPSSAGESVGARGVRVRRGRLRDGDDRLPGDRHRPELRGAVVCFTAPMVGNYGVATGAPSRAPARARGPDARGAGPEWTDWLRAASSRSRASTRAPSSSICATRRDAGGRRRRRRAVDEALGACASSRRWPARRSSPVSTKRAVHLSDAGDARVAVVDYGCKRSILRRLAARGAAVTVFPHDVDADELAGYDGVLLSNGPGDPEPLGDESRDGARAARPRAGARRSASATSCSGSRPATRRSSCRSATAARTIRCSIARTAACS